MKQEIDKPNAPQPTNNQFVRADHILETLESLIDSTSFKAFHNAFIRVISDIVSVDKLHQLEVNVNETFLISHSASFRRIQDAQRFARLTSYSGYLVKPVEKNVIEDLYKVLFVHSGTFALEEILIHTMPLDKSAIQMNGGYDGWEVVMD